MTAVLNYEHAVKAAVSVAGYATPMEMLHEQAKSMMGWFSRLTYPFEWAYQKCLFGKAAGLLAIDGINNSNIPGMVIHGSGDEVIQYDGAGIISHKEQITNPNVVYITRDSENQNGHNNLIASEAASNYIMEKNNEYETIYDVYDGDIPDEVNNEYYNGINKFLSSELDTAFMDEVNAFFEQHVE